MKAQLLILVIVALAAIASAKSVKKKSSKSGKTLSDIFLGAHRKQSIRCINSNIKRFRQTISYVENIRYLEQAKLTF